MSRPTGPIDLPTIDFPMTPRVSHTASSADTSSRPPGHSDPKRKRKHHLVADHGSEDAQRAKALDFLRSTFPDPPSHFVHPSRAHLVGYQFKPQPTAGPGTEAPPAAKTNTAAPSATGPTTGPPPPRLARPARERQLPVPPPECLEDYGLARAMAQLELQSTSDTPTAARPRAPRKQGPEGAPQSALPTAIPSETPNIDSLHFSPEQVRAFEEGLSTTELASFRAGTRLPDPEASTIRQDLLDTLTPQQRADRGLFFPDEPALPDTPPRSEALETAERDADSRSSAFRPPPGLQAILMVLWYVTDPLWLDFTARNIRDGFNLACSAESSSDTATKCRPRNMINDDDPEQKQLLNDAMDKEISRGNSTAFSKEPLFDNYRLVPCGVVPKKDDSVWRFIKNYSHCLAELLSLNEQSPKARPSWCRFEKVVQRFAKALTGWASSWDMQNAYPWLRVRKADHHLTVSFVEGRGYSHRLRGDMGNARTGFVWEISGGRTLSTLYETMSYFTTVDEDGTVHLETPVLPAEFKARAANVDPSRPPRAQGFGDVSQESMLSDEARALLETEPYQARLRRPDAVDLTDTSRWVDDWINFCADWELGRRNDLALVEWHRLFGFPLAVDKFLGTAEAREFFGVVFNPREGTMYFSDAKMKKINDLLDSFLGRPDSKKSRGSWARLVGYLLFFTLVFPSMRPFIAALSKRLTVAQRIEDRNARVRKGTPTTSPDEDSLRELRCWKRFAMLAPRTIVPDLVPDSEAAAQATVVAHTDWSGAPDQGRLGFVVLSHGVFGSGPMQPVYYEPVKPEAKLAASAVGEATAVLALLVSCADIVRNNYVVVFTDNETFYRRFHRAKPRHGSIALDLRIQDIALTLTSLNARLCLYFVPGTECLADPLTRSPAQGFATFMKRLEEKIPSCTFSEIPLSLPTTPLSRDGRLKI